MSKSLAAIAEEHFRYLKVLNKADSTIEHQRYGMRRWLAFCAAQGITSLEQVTPKHVSAFQVSNFEARNEDGKQRLGVISQNANLRAAKNLLRWAFLEGRIPTDPAQHVPYARQPKTLPKTVLTTTEMRRLLNAPATNTPLGYRDRAFLELLYSCMARRDEMRNIRLNDLDFEHGTVRINDGKGGKDRTVPMGKMASRYVKHYVEQVRPRLLRGKDDGYLFISVKGTQVCKDTINRMVRDHGEAAGIAKRVHTHVFRASGLTHMLRNGANVRHLMDIAGHSSMNSLNPYIHVEISDVQETHARTHPRELEP